MIKDLCDMMMARCAPGQAMWCSSPLTALAKPDGGVGPIATGELPYRILLSYQFGAGTKRGFEPIICIDRHSVGAQSAKSPMNALALIFVAWFGLGMPQGCPRHPNPRRKAAPPVYS
ncbi:hypothetical protein EHS25_004821 [Saitozyma podzolica]|uniref:Uncharacterized protein n=1 Tax=Saitozyma podzolica TaxID=1890683 RepID=A0A427Y376_9TREE|nr:hypothetical protein EHS25_004821 [Saitozyma podzolica]